MLDELVVHNLGLIAEAHLEPGPGLVVITGETGAGKTLLLGALRLLKGETARKDQIGPTAEEASVEGRFIVDGQEHVVRRRVDTSRSRAYVDGKMVTAGAIAQQFAPLVDIVGQHDRNALAEPAAVRGLIDGALDVSGSKRLDTYHEAWASLRAIEARIEQLGGDRHALQREREVVRFQAAEISEAGFSIGDDVELGRLATRLRNAESLGERLAAAARAIAEEGATGSLEQAVRDLTIAAKTDPSLQPLVDLGAEAAVLVADLSAEIAGVTADFERDPEQLDHVEKRLALLAELQRKYGDDLDGVLGFGVDAAKRSAELEALLADAGELDTAHRKATDAVGTAGADLRRARGNAAERLAKGAAAHLVDLGFSSPVVRFRIDEADPGPRGTDRIVLEFSSDISLEPKSAARIASGGELSRLALALRLASGVEDGTVIAFDEIDAGTGGETALAMGRKLAALSKGRQVFCVTHLPQVAAFADQHLAVSRDGTTATVTMVEGDDRVEELSRMLAGLPESERGREHAAELLVLAAGR
ncbi:MAG: DNA repair protein RecN [Acidimicrobiia bacterium]|nr:MAG: DNA repair protein RecN [Acidimicrobiia bacterium]